MLRRVLIVVALLGLFTGLALADDFKATIKKVDADNNSIVLTVNGEEKTFNVAKDAEIYSTRIVKKKETKDAISGGLSALKTGSDVSITTIKKGGKEIVVSIKVEKGGKKK